MLREGEYEVEDILRKQIKNGKAYYRIKWVGFPSNQNTWEPVEHLNAEMIAEYEQTQRDRYEEKVRKQNYSKMKKMLPGHFHQQVKILGHFVDDEGNLAFEVSQKGRRIAMKREQLIERHGELLCRFYVEMAKKNKKY